MSVLIKGENMPMECSECAFAIFPTCLLTRNRMEYRARREDCPLIEVPKHGRLIDESKLPRNVVIAYKPYIGEQICNYKEIAVFDSDIKDAPTVIEAEE